MAYKRKARILFLSILPGIAQLAATYARDLGSDWIEAKCASPQPDAAQRESSASSLPACPSMSAELLANLDLIVTLGKTARGGYFSLPSGVRQRHFQLSCTLGDAMADEIRQIVLGIVGGLKMLSRSE